MTDVVEPTVDESGEETHPAFGQISAGRITSTPGAVLFDSEIQHRQLVRIQIRRASRKRDLNHDWIYGRDDLIEVSMSEAQWASFVSSMNTSGVSCTIDRVGFESMPELPYAPRLAVSMAETRSAADRAYAGIREAFATYSEHKTAGNLRALHAAIDNAASNVGFAGKTLAAHVENTVEKARADLEAMVALHANQLGLDAAGLTAPLALESSPS